MRQIGRSEDDFKQRRYSPIMVHRERRHATGPNVQNMNWKYCGGCGHVGPAGRVGDIAPHAALSSPGLVAFFFMMFWHEMRCFKWVKVIYYSHDTIQSDRLKISPESVMLVDKSPSLTGLVVLTVRLLAEGMCLCCVYQRVSLPSLRTEIDFQKCKCDILFQILPHTSLTNVSAQFTEILLISMVTEPSN